MEVQTARKRLRLSDVALISLTCVILAGLVVVAPAVFLFVRQSSKSAIIECVKDSDGGKLEVQLAQTVRGLPTTVQSITANFRLGSAAAGQAVGSITGGVITWQADTFLCLPFNLSYVPLVMELADGVTSTLLGKFTWQDGSALRSEYYRGTFLDSQFGRSMEVIFRFYPSMYLEEVAASLHTGDILLFAGDTASGWAISTFTLSQWSHVGMVYRTPAATSTSPSHSPSPSSPTAAAGAGAAAPTPQSPPSTTANIPYAGPPRNASLPWPLTELFVIESSTNKVFLNECTLGRPIKGVEKLSLHDKVFCGSYNLLAVRRLVNVTQGYASLHKHIDAFLNEVHYRPYQHFNANVAMSRLDFVTQNNYAQLFCSEFCAAAFQKAGLITPLQFTSNYMPNEFSSEVTNRLPTPPLLGARYSNEVYIRGTQKWGHASCSTYKTGCQC